LKAVLGLVVIIIAVIQIIQGAPPPQKKVIPQEKFDISGIVADFFTKFTMFTDEGSGHISCIFY